MKLSAIFVHAFLLYHEFFSGQKAESAQFLIIKTIIPGQPVFVFEVEI